MKANHGSQNTVAPVLILLLSLLAAQHAASAAITIGPTINLPWSQVDFQGGTVAMLANGSFAIASLRPDLNTFEVQFFNAVGDLMTPALFIPPVGSSEDTGGVGVGSMGGSYIVVRQDFRGADITQPYAHAYAQLYSDRGTPLGAQFLWPASDLPNFADFYRFGSAPLWRFLPITYEFLPDVGPDLTYQVSLRVGEPNPLPQLPPLQVGVPVVSNIEDAAINGRGRFVVDSLQCASYPPPILPCIRGIQIFDDAAKPLTAFRTGDVTQTAFSAFAAINAKGEVMLHFLTPAGRAVVRLYDANASQESAQIPLNTLHLYYETYVGMKGLDDGSFVLAWTARDPQGASGNGEALLIARFDPQSQSFDEPIVIAIASYHFRKAVLNVNGDGRGVIVWETQGIDPFGTTAGYLRLIRATQ
jgi:hypothetical protein